MKKPQRRRSNCPVNFALQSFGDRWSLLIVRDIVYFGKYTYGDFLSSPEGIATNILANRLAWLEQQGILQKTTCPTDRRKDTYSLTEKGLDLIPLLFEMARWSVRHDPLTDTPPQWVERMQADRETALKLARETVARGGAVAAGPNSVLQQMGLLP